MDIGRQLAAIAIVFGLLGAAVVLLRKYGPHTRIARRPAAEPVLEVMEQLSLTPAHRLHLVRIAGRAVLIATHASGATLIDSGASTPSTKECA